MADGKEVAQQVKADPKTVRASDRTWALARASERKGLTLDVKDKGEGKLYLIINSDGVRANGAGQVGRRGAGPQPHVQEAGRHRHQPG